jgi:hypothetical protein
MCGFLNVGHAEPGRSVHETNEPPPVPEPAERFRGNLHRHYNRRERRRRKV